jgi:hypothetical protein
LVHACRILILCHFGAIDLKTTQIHIAHRKLVVRALGVDCGIATHNERPGRDAHRVADRSAADALKRVRAPSGARTGADPAAAAAAASVATGRGKKGERCYERKQP